MRTLTNLTGLALAAAALAAGCASTGRQRSEHLAESIHDTVSAVDACGTSRTAAFGSLDALVGEPVENLPAKFATFNADVDRVVSSDSSLRNAVASMKSSAIARHKAWGEDNASYADNDMQVRTQKSRATAAESFRKVMVDTDAMLEKSGAFVTYLSDFRRILSNDLSTQGVESIQGFAKKARSSSADLDEMSASIRASLGETVNAMETKVATK